MEQQSTPLRPPSCFLLCSAGPPAKLTGPDTRTATFSLALDATTVQNGCLRFVPGSGKEKKLWPHVPLGASREEAHGIGVDVKEKTEENPDGHQVEYCEIPRGSVTVHDEWVVHGSSGNMSDGHRRTYVIAYRTEETVRKERAMGFSHSHNDSFNWDEFHDWGKEKAS